MLNILVFFLIISIIKFLIALRISLIQRPRKINIY